jgi:predicted dithiol-disulfide oxidoreductase (DUF899 family)
MTNETKSGHLIASPQQWHAARLALLEQEKELTKHSDEVARQRAVGAAPWLDRAPLGRNEDGYWWHLHDEYERA